MDKYTVPETWNFREKEQFRRVFGEMKKDLGEEVYFMSYVRL